MNNCDICANENDELYSCTSCASLFCPGCGNSARAYCGDCNEFVGGKDGDGMDLDSFDDFD